MSKYYFKDGTSTVGQLFKDKILHRTDGPAVEFWNGDKQWMINGKLHRIDGPAIDYKNVKFYYINDEEFTEEKFNKYNKLIRIIYE
jgi:hypothetical protein